MAEWRVQSLMLAFSAATLYCRHAIAKRQGTFWIEPETSHRIVIFTANRELARCQHFNPSCRCPIDVSLGNRNICKRTSPNRRTIQSLNVACEVHDLAL